MSTIRNTAWTLAATVALGTGTMAAGAGQAQAARISAASCNGGANVHCSMFHARNMSSNVGVGSTGRSVSELQRSLRELRYQVRVTGVFDAQTKAYVKKYQASRKISTTGFVGPQTRHALRVGAGAKVRTRAVTSSVQVAPASSRAQAAVNFAYAQLGKPYVYGATGPYAYDCSGLTSAAWRAAGKSIPRTSSAQLYGLQRVSLSNAQPGDLVVFYGGGHVGIYIGNGKVIHAPRPGQSVKIASVSSMPVTGVVRP